VPDADPKVFDGDEGRKAVVVRVQPVAVPPSITSDGIVFVRVSGQTLPVTDQAVLADMLARGRMATEGAEASAREAALALYRQGDPFQGARIAYALGVASVGHIADKSSRLFSPEFVETLDGLARTLNVEHGVRRTPGRAFWQDRVVFAHGEPGDQRSELPRGVLGWQCRVLAQCGGRGAPARRSAWRNRARVEDRR
jgi:hypothetical protein